MKPKFQIKKKTQTTKAILLSFISLHVKNALVAFYMCDYVSNHSFVLQQSPATWTSSLGSV